MPSEWEIVDTFPDKDGHPLSVGVKGGMVGIGLLTEDAVALLGADLQERFAQAYVAACHQAKVSAGAVARAHRRPCCDHCNNGEGDPAGHDYTLSGPHDGPCGECAAERARREHDEGTG